MRKYCRSPRLRVGCVGKSLPILGLLKAGAVAFSDDGMPVAEDKMILAAMER